MTLNGSASHDAYARAALESECATVANTTVGRNSQLNRSGFSLAGFCPSGALDCDEIEQRLMQAAEINGYIAKDGRAAALATIRSGISQGLREPRAVPENGRASGHNGRGPATARPHSKPAPSVSGVRIPDWTVPDPATGRPKLVGVGAELPPNLANEVPNRRHIYWRDGQAVRAKIKMSAGKAAFIDLYRVFRPETGEVGWQAKKPLGWVPVPYVGQGNAFDQDMAGEILFWPEGEKDVDTLVAAGLNAFTYGGSSDVPGGCELLLRDRDVVILADNDEPGHACAGRKVAAINGVAKRVRVVGFPELPPGGDVSDYMAAGDTIEGLWAHVDAAVPIEAPATQQASKGQSANDHPQWPEPKPLPSSLLPVMSFDPDMVPACLGPWIGDIADRMQCPPDFVAIPAVVALASTLGRKIAVRPQSRTDWVEVPNLWGCIVGRPGAMKSPAMAEALKPLNRLEAEARARNEEQLKEYQLDLTAHKLKQEEGQKAARAAIKAGADDVREFIGFDEPVKPAARRYIVGDTTYEALGEILVSNPNGILAFRDELISLLKTLDREEYINARGFFLTGWNGTSGYPFDRIGRGSTYIDAVCISLLGVDPAWSAVRVPVARNQGRRRQRRPLAAVRAAGLAR